MEQKTQEPQYQRCLDVVDEIGFQTLGLMTNHLWLDDPRHLVFSLARYKFVSKMLSGRKNVLEVGCGDAFSSRLVQQEVGALTAVDFDPVFVADVNRRMVDKWRFECFVHDMLAGPVPGSFDGAYSLDVIEHIEAVHEDTFLGNIVSSLTAEGVLVVGSPSLESQVYASKYSKEGHVNCKKAPELKELLLRYFDTVMVFSMNDEVVHTGYSPMAHYLMAVCSGKRTR